MCHNEEVWRSVVGLRWWETSLLAGDLREGTTEERAPEPSFEGWAKCKERNVWAKAQVVCLSGDTMTSQERRSKKEEDWRNINFRHGVEAIKEDFGTSQFYSGGSGRGGSEEGERGGERLDTDWRALWWERVWIKYRKAEENSVHCVKLYKCLTFGL